MTFCLYVWLSGVLDSYQCYGVIVCGAIVCRVMCRPVWACDDVKHKARNTLVRSRNTRAPGCDCSGPTSIKSSVT